MRDFEQCKAEVFHRSAERIRKRRQKRIHITLLCIPLVFCVGFFFFAAANSLMSKSDGAAESSKNDFNYSYNNSSGSSAEAPELSPEFHWGYGSAQNSQKPGTQQPPVVFFMDGEEIQLSDSLAAGVELILTSLQYSPHKVCRCLPQYKVQIGDTTYGIHLGEGYARCDAGQADLSEDQIAFFEYVFDWIAAHKGE